VLDRGGVERRGLLAERRKLASGFGHPRKSSLPR
jgi:hypothetical protein